MISWDTGVAKTQINCKLQIVYYTLQTDLSLPAKERILLKYDICKSMHFSLIISKSHDSFTDKIRQTRIEFENIPQQICLCVCNQSMIH